VLNATDFKVLAILLLVVGMSEGVNSSYSESSTEGINDTAWLNLITGKVVVTNEVLSWLVHIEVLRKLLSPQH
jgi:hypothetical protein